MVLDLTITICARSGSQRLPQKNTLKLGGITLIDLAIKLALQIVPKDCIIFSSDSEDYLSMAAKKKVKLHKRGEDLANAHVSKIDVFKSLTELSNSKYFIDLDVTAPIREVSDVVGLYTALKGKDIAFAAVKMESINPYFNMVEVKQDGRLGTVAGGSFSRSQDTPSVFLLNGLMGWERSYLGKSKNIFETDNWGMHLMSPEKMFDIDNRLDFEIIKTINRLKK